MATRTDTSAHGALPHMYSANCLQCCHLDCHLVCCRLGQQRQSSKEWDWDGDSDNWDNPSTGRISKPSKGQKEWSSNF